MEEYMKFLLTAVNAKYIHSNPAIYSLKAYAGEQNAPHIQLAEFTINEKVETILEQIYARQPDVIGFSCYIWNIGLIRLLLAELPKILPDTDIWLGGPEVTYDAPGWLQQYPRLRGVMVGEGEAAFKELLETYLHIEAEEQQDISAAQQNGAAEEQRYTSAVQQNGAAEEQRYTSAVQQNGAAETADCFAHIPGLCLPGGYTEPRQPLNLSDIPFIYEDTALFQNRIIYYESSRGCPFSCSYCLSSIDKNVRLRRTDLVEKELQFFLDRKVKQVKFVDRTFNCRRSHTRRIWTYLRDHDNGVTNFHFEIAADLLNEEEIDLLRSLRPGLVQLEIGVQSTNEQTIHEIHRVMDVEKLAAVSAAVKAGQNVHQHLDLIVGLPYENYESFGRSFDRVFAMEPDQLQMGFLKVLKGSFMHVHAAEYGIAYTDYAPYEVLSTNWLTYAEVRRLKRIEEMVELYYNSGQFVHTLDHLLPYFDGPFAFFEALAEYFSEQGYDIQTPSRLYRYEVLLQFAEVCITKQQPMAEDRITEQPLMAEARIAAQQPMAETCMPERQRAEALDRIKEALVLDLYLRENMKSRPVFASTVTEEMKAYHRAFYRTEAENRRYLPAYREFDRMQLARQTHMEWFRYPVWEKPEKEGTDHASGAKYCMLFDYRSRDALNHGARTVLIEECSAIADAGETTKNYK